MKNGTTARRQFVNSDNKRVTAGNEITVIRKFPM
jgi:hypothetical protein